MSARLQISLHAVGVRRGDKWVLRNISLQLNPGERWALTGQNGAGKTQLLKLIGADVWPTPTGNEVREYRLGRRRIEIGEAKRRIAYVGAEFQDKYARYGWNPSVFDLLGTGLHGTDLLLQLVATAERRPIARMLELCGLKPLKSRPFLSLSYGQKRVALLARALVQRPDWLLLDEFYNGLDQDFRRRVDAILEHVRKRGQAWVIAAHRASDIPRGTRKLIELARGRVRSMSPLQDADLTHLSAEAEEALRAGFTRAPPRPRRGRPILRIKAASLYVDYRPVLRQVNWELRQGEQWAVFGANGAGKTSFLRLLYGDLSPAHGGNIERNGFPFGTPIEAWKRRTGYVSPDLQTEYAVDVSLLELVASGRYASIGLCEPTTSKDCERALHWLRFFALSTLAERRPRELSYGQLRRALFARALAANPRLLLLDEPLTGLDPPQRAAMKRLLARLMTQGRTLVIAVHHPEDLPPGMTHALDLHKGRARELDSQSAT